MTMTYARRSRRIKRDRRRREAHPVPCRFCQTTRLTRGQKPKAWAWDGVCDDCDLRIHGEPHCFDAPPIERREFDPDAVRLQQADVEEFQLGAFYDIGEK